MIMTSSSNPANSSPAENHNLNDSKQTSWLSVIIFIAGLHKQYLTRQRLTGGRKCDFRYRNVEMQWYSIMIKVPPSTPHYIIKNSVSVVWKLLVWQHNVGQAGTVVARVLPMSDSDTSEHHQLSSPTAGQSELTISPAQVSHLSHLATVITVITVRYWCDVFS